MGGAAAHAQVSRACLAPCLLEAYRDTGLAPRGRKSDYDHRMSGSGAKPPIELHAHAVASAQIHATARVIANFAWQHLRAATMFRDQLVSIEASNARTVFGSFFEDIRSYGSACIMSAAASIEALINELFINPEGPLRKKFEDFETEFWGANGIERKRSLEKYQVALDMLGKPRIDEQTSSFRNAWALFELRNALVHYKPTWDPIRQRNVELIEILSGQFEPSKFPDSGADFVTMRAMSGDCMNWVITTVINFLRDFDSRSRLDDNKMSGFWRFET